MKTKQEEIDSQLGWRDRTSNCSTKAVTMIVYFRSEDTFRGLGEGLFGRFWSLIGVFMPLVI